MMRKVVPALLLVLTMVVAGCGPAIPPSTSGETAGGEMFMMAFPRLVIDFDAEGNPSAFGIPLSVVGPLLGQDMSGLQLPKYYVDWMTAGQVQHIELRQTGDSLALLVNSKPMPRVAWSDESLGKALDVAEALNVQNTDVIRRLLPIVRRLGLNVVLRFPRAEGAEEIKMADPSVALAPPKATEDAPTFIVQLEVKYDAQGVPSILGMSARELSSLGLNLPLALAPSFLASLQAQNIQYMELRTKPDGLYLYANGDVLPNLVWDRDLLSNAADLYAQLNPTSPFNTLIKQFIPLVAGLDATVLLHFPPAPGAEAIEVTVH